MKTRNRVIAVLVSFVMVVLSLIAPMETVNAYENDEASYTVYSASGTRLGTYTIEPSEELAASSSLSTAQLVGEDNRYKDYSLCSGIAQIKTNEGSGTGFVVGDHLIATAAHVVYSYKTNNPRKIKSIEFHNESNEVYLEISSANIIEYHVPTSFIDAHDSEYTKELQNYDYSLIYVETDLSECQHFNLGFMLDDFEGNVYVTGYQGGDYDLSGELATAEGVVTKKEEYLLYYDADTTSGVSGSPVYIKSSYNGNVSYTAVAIHIGYSGEDNIGRRITTNVLQFYRNNDFIGTFS